MVEQVIGSVDSSSHLMMKNFEMFLIQQYHLKRLESAFNEAGVDYDAIFSAARVRFIYRKQLKTVAKMIAGRASTGNNRPIFFVKMGNFDAHQNLLEDPHR